MSATAFNSVEDSWAALRTLTLSMRTAADAEEWSQVLELATRRHADLLRHFERFPVGPGNAEFYQRNLTEMLSSESELQTLTVAARKQVLRDGLIHNRTRNAVAAYRMN